MSARMPIGDNDREASMMEYTTHHDVEQQLSELVSSTLRARLTFPLMDVARDALAQGHEKDALIEDFASPATLTRRG